MLVFGLVQLICNYITIIFSESHYLLQSTYICKILNIYGDRLDKGSEGGIGISKNNTCSHQLACQQPFGGHLWY